FDLGVGDASVRPGPEQGYAACVVAGEEVAEGNVGAGTGATVAKLHGIERAVKGGLGAASRREGDLVVGVLAAVNAFGEIVDDQGDTLAGARPGDDPEAAAPEAPPQGQGS